MTEFYGKDIYKMEQVSSSEFRYGLFISVQGRPVGVCSDEGHWWVVYKVADYLLPQRFDICCGQAVPISHPDMRLYDEYSRRYVVIHDYHAYVHFGDKEYNRKGKVTRPY